MKGIINLTKNIFVSSLVFFIFMESWDADNANIKSWYDRTFEDWRSFGEYLNKNLKSNILIFFEGRAFQHHIAIYSNKRTAKLIYHSSNSSDRERIVWQAVNQYSHSRKKIEELEKQGFKMILDIEPEDALGRIYEKGFDVKSPVCVKFDRSGSWVYVDAFKDFKLVEDCFSLRNIYYSQLEMSISPSISDEECDIVYKFKCDKSAKIRSFMVNGGFSIGPEAFGKVELSLDGMRYIELVKKNSKDNITSFNIELSNYLKDMEVFYIKITLFAKWMPNSFVDSAGNVVLAGLNFSAQCKNE